MKLILFDIDGTLIHGGRPGRRSLTAAFRETFGLADVDSAMNWVAFNGRTDPAIIRDIARAGGITPERLEDNLVRLFESYLRHLREITASPHGTRPCPGIPALLDELERRRGVALGLLTGNIEAGGRVKLQPFDLNRYFPEGGFGSDSEDRNVIAGIARRKFEVLLGRPIPAGNVVVVGDTIHDVACGRHNGFHTLAVATGGVSMDDLRAAKPDLLFETLGDVDAVLAALDKLVGIPAG